MPQPDNNLDDMFTLDPEPASDGGTLHGNTGFGERVVDAANQPRGYGFSSSDPKDQGIVERFNADYPPSGQEQRTAAPVDDSMFELALETGEQETAPAGASLFELPAEEPESAPTVREATRMSRKRRRELGGKRAEQPGEDGFFSNVGDLASEGFGQTKANVTALFGTSQWERLDPEARREVAEVLAKAATRTDKPRELEEYLAKIAKESDDVGAAWEEGKYGTAALQSVDFLGSALWESITNPEGFAYMNAEQSGNLAMTWAPGLALGKTGAAAGGSLAGPAGATVGGTAGFLGGAALGSYLVETGAQIREFIQEQGGDPTDPENVLRALNSPSLRSDMLKRASAKGLSVAAWDAVANLLGIKLLKGATGAKSVATRAAAAEGAQVGGAFTGEVQGQLWAKGDVDAAEVGQEVAMELGPGGPVDIGLAAYSARSRQGQANAEGEGSAGDEALDAEPIVGEEEPEARPAAEPAEPTEETPGPSPLRALGERAKARTPDLAARAKAAQGERLRGQERPQNTLMADALRQAGLAPEEAQEIAESHVQLPEGLEDARLRREDFRVHLERMSNELVEGGGIAYTRDENGRINGRTPSQNPEWFQSLAADSETKLSVKKARKAVKKALEGEKLGEREARFVHGMLETVSGERSEDVPYVRQHLEAARRLRRAARGEASPIDALESEYEAEAGRIFEEDEYPEDFDAEARAYAELQQEALETDEDAAIAVLESPEDTPRIELAQRLWAIVQRGRENEATQQTETQSTGPGPVPAGQGADTEEPGARPQAPPAQEESLAPETPAPAGVSTSGVPRGTETLEPYTEADLQARADAQAQQQQAEAQADQKAQADAERDQFALTGSDLPADQAAAQGQQDLLSQPRAQEQPAEPKSDISTVPDSVFSGFPDLVEADSGLIPLHQFTQKEQDALRAAGLVEAGELKSGKTHEGVNPEKLWPERQRRFEAQRKTKQPTTDDATGDAKQRGLRAIRKDFEENRENPDALDGLLNELWPMIDGRNDPRSRSAQRLHDQIQEAYNTAAKKPAKPKTPELSEKEVKRRLGLVANSKKKALREAGHSDADIAGMSRKDIDRAVEAAKTGNNQKAKATAPKEEKATAKQPESPPRSQGAGESVDRRRNLEVRKKVADMSPEEMRRALLVDKLTGIGNRRAYEESEKLPVQVSIDVDALKWVNDNMGHQSGDKLLRLMGEALGAETSEAYHISGDEFVVQADTKKDATNAVEAATERLRQATITVEHPDGGRTTKTGVEFSYGIGQSLEEAESRLQASKAERERQGIRAPRGGEPSGVARSPATGKQDHERGAAEEEVKGDTVEPAGIDEAAHEAAASPKNDHPAPTEGQTRVGNYKKGHVRLHGLDISIENPKGSERSGTDRGGKKWSVKMAHHYGYFRGTQGAGLNEATGKPDHIDVFLGPDAENADRPVFVIDQVDPNTRRFDEHKVMMGFKNEEAARRGYLANYSKGWDGIGGVKQFTLDEFKDWIEHGDHTKRVAEPDKQRVLKKKAAKKKASEPDPFAESTLREEYPYQEAVSAYRHSTSNPKVPADMHRTDYVDTVRELQKDLTPLAETDEQKAVLDEQLKQFKAEYLRRDKTVLNSRAGVLSSHISGRSKFNSRQANRRNNALDRTMDGFFKWVEDAKERVKQAVLDARTPEQKQRDTKDRLDKARKEAFNGYVGDIAGAVSAMSQPGMDKAAFRPKATKALKKALEQDKDATLKAMAFIEKKVAQEGGLGKVVGTRSDFWKTYQAALAESKPEIDDTAEGDDKPMETREPEGLYSGNERESSNLQSREPDQGEPLVQGTLDLEPAPSVSANREQQRDNFYVRYRRVPTGSIRIGLDRVTTPEEAAHVFSPLRKHGEEVFHTLVLGKDGKILDLQMHSKGTRNGAGVHPEVVIPSIAAVEGAESVYYAHNHPSGEPRPSRADLNITEKLDAGLKSTGITPAGHIVLGKGQDAWYFANEKYGAVVTHPVKIKPRLRKRDQQITERKIRKVPQSDIPALTSPDESRAFVKNMESDNALVLLNNKHKPVGTMTLTEAEMKRLGANGQVNRILRGIDATNASAAIIKATNERAAHNLWRFLQDGEKIRVLDAFTPEDGRLQSMAEQGLIPDNGPWYSRKQSTKEAYDRRIDELFAGDKPKRAGVRVLDHSDILDLLGYGDLPVVLKESKVTQGQFTHGLTAEDWKKIPEWMENPAAVFDSETVPGRLVIIAPETVDGAPVFMIAEPDTQEGGVDVHLLVNAYDKTGGRAPVSRWVDEGLLRYLDQKQSPGLRGTSGLQLPRVTTHLNRGSKGKIYTNRDLVKYRSRQSIAEKPAEHQGSTVHSVREHLIKRVGKRTIERLESDGFTIVQSDSDLPGRLQHPEGGVRAVHDPVTGRTYMVADNVPKQDAEGVLLHDVGVHYGLERMLGTEQFQQVLKELRGMLKAGHKGMKAARAKVPNDVPSAYVDEETLGYFVEANPKQSLAQRVLGAIRAFLRKLGVVKRITDNDLVSMAKAAVRSRSRGVQTQYAPAYSAPASKKWGAKVGKTVLGRSRETQELKQLTAQYPDPATRPDRVGDRIVELMKTSDVGENTEVHVLDVTPEMRESALKGQPLFARLRRELARLWTELAKNDDIFQQPRSSKTTLREIANEIDPGMKVEKLDGEHRETWKVTMPSGRSATVTARPDGTIVLNAANLRTGDRGSALYNAVATLAHNTGKVFIGDPDGLSTEARYRRTENMLSSALKFGTTRHLRPHPDQRLGWVEGDDVGNLTRLIEQAYKNVKEHVPLIEDTIYDFEQGQFVSADTGRAVGEDQFRKLANSAAGRAANAGRSTLKRAAITNTFLRGEGSQAGDGLLVDFVRQLSQQLDKPLKNTLYSRKKTRPSAGSSDSGAQNGRPARQQKLLDDAKSGQPIDKIFRAAFDLGGLTSKATKGAYNWLERQVMEGEPREDGLFGWTKPILDHLRAGLIDRYGLSEEYKKRDFERQAEEKRILMEGADFIHATMDRGMDVKEAAILKRMLEGEHIPESDWNDLAEPIRKALDDMGHELVELGWLDAETYERNRGTWLHRVYMKHETDQGNFGRWLSNQLHKRRVKMVGKQLRGRGMNLEVAPASLLKSAPQNWWGHTRVKDKPDPSLHGTKWVVLDRVQPVGQGTENLEGTGEGGRRPRILERMYWPADQEVPARYGAWENKGTWEVRGSKRGKFVLWRDFTKEERTRMGEILDARYLVAKSYHLMANDVSTARFFDDIAKNPEWTWHGEVPPDPRTIGSPKDILRTYVGFEWIKVPENKLEGTQRYAWGPLAGKYVRAEIWRDLNELRRLQTPNLWRKAMTQWKLNKTARNPVVHMNNVMSNFMFMDMADVRWRDLVRGWQALRSEDEHFRDAMEHGVFGHNFVDQEIKRNIIDPLLDELLQQNKGELEADADARISKLGSMVSTIWKHLKRADQALLIDTYSMEDEVFRMATYMRRRSLGDPADVAARFAREQFLNYDIRAPWINALRGTVLPFIAYTYRAVPVIAESLAHRPWKLAKYYAIAHGVEALSYALAPSDDDEDKERRSLRDETQGYTWVGVPRMLRMPWRDDHGNPVFLDIRRWIPAGDVFDMNQGQFAVPIPAPLQFGGPLMLAAELALNKQSFTGREIVNEKTDTGWDKAKKIGAWAWRSWMPAAPWIPESWYWDKIQRAMPESIPGGGGGRDVLGRDYPLGYAIASSLGIKLAPHDVDLGFEWKRREFEQIERALDFEAKQLHDDLRRNLISESEFHEGMREVKRKLKALQENAKETFLGED